MSASLPKQGTPLSSSPASALPADPPGGRRAIAVWSVGVSVYFVAVVFRTSLGVAGLDAAERYDIGSSALSTFSILQLLVYAGMQIPVGLLVDRFGTKRVLSMGAVLFTAGQLGFAFAPSFGTALASRALLGCGDAMTFISVLRLGTRWFPPRRGAVIAQLAGLLGQAGNLVSTLVLSQLLHGLGWTKAFAGSAVAGVVVLVLVQLFLKDHPEGQSPAPGRHPGGAYVRRQIAESWRETGTRLGMWTHFTTQFPGMMFLLLWGMPFLVEAQGLSRGTASGLLTLVVATSLLFGLLFGQVVGRNPAFRLRLALGTVTGVLVVWTATLAWPADHAPMWLLVMLCAVLGACGPASLIGFDFSRPANPPERQGTASGIVNMGGFVASMLTLLLVGVLLDATGGNYRAAFSVVYVLAAVGLSQILRLRKKAVLREREQARTAMVEVVASSTAAVPGPRHGDQAADGPITAAR